MYIYIYIYIISIYIYIYVYMYIYIYIYIDIDIYIYIIRSGASESLTPEDIQVDWLGGYWKLPQADMKQGCRKPLGAVSQPCKRSPRSAQDLGPCKGAADQPS